MQRYQRQFSVLVIFGATFLYNDWTLSGSSVEEPHDPSDPVTNQEMWDVTSKKPTKIFSNVFQGKLDDWYRVGAYVTVNQSANIDVYLQSFSSGDVLVGSFEVFKNTPQYREVIFHVPSGMYSDIKFVLRATSDSKLDSFSGARLSKLFISRLNVKNQYEADKLTPTEVKDSTNAILLTNARIEDFGNEAIYSYHLSGEADDLSDILYSNGTIWFDEKKRRVVGSQRNGTEFVYRFFTKNPFERLSLSARSIEGDGKEVKLEYSLDKSTWEEIPETQEGGRSQLFSFTLPGTNRQDTVYVKVSYIGEEKKTGSFGLDQLSIRAQLKQK